VTLRTLYGNAPTVACTLSRPIEWRSPAASTARSGTPMPPRTTAD
jgi:hypothetical protein